MVSSCCLCSALLVPSAVTCRSIKRLVRRGHPSVRLAGLYLSRVGRCRAEMAAKFAWPTRTTGTDCRCHWLRYKINLADDWPQHRLPDGRLRGPFPECGVILYFGSESCCMFHIGHWFADYTNCSDNGVHLILRFLLNAFMFYEYRDTLYIPKS